MEYENYWKTTSVELENIKKEVDSDRIKEVEFYKKGGILLDIGCGQAHFAELAKQRGWKVYTIDPSRKSREICKRKNITMITFNEIHTISPQAVTMWHVIEHFENPYKYLKKLGRQLEQGTVLCMETPNKDSWNARWHWKTWWYNQPEHLYYFTSDTIRSALEKAGFFVIKIWPVGGFLANKQKKAVAIINKNFEIFRLFKKIYYYISQSLHLSDCIRIVAVKQ